jgi:hypothetical protein
MASRLELGLELELELSRRNANDSNEMGREDLSERAPRRAAHTDLEYLHWQAGGLCIVVAFGLSLAAIGMGFFLGAHRPAPPPPPTTNGLKVATTTARPDTAACRRASLSLVRAPPRVESSRRVRYKTKNSATRNAGGRARCSHTLCSGDLPKLGQDLIFCSLLLLLLLLVLPLSLLLLSLSLSLLCSAEQNRLQFDVANNESQVAAAGRGERS